MDYPLGTSLSRSSELLRRKKRKEETEQKKKKKKTNNLMYSLMQILTLAIGLLCLNGLSQNLISRRATSSLLILEQHFNQ